MDGSPLRFTRRPKVLIAADRRFVRWCRACEWNLDPLAETGAGGRRQRLFDELAARNAMAVYRDVASHGPGDRGLDVLTAVAFVVAIVVHLVTVVLAACALAIAVRTGRAPLGLFYAVGVGFIAATRAQGRLYPVA